MKNWYDSDEAKALREQHEKPCSSFVTTMDQSWTGPQVCVQCGHSEVAHRVSQMKMPGEYISAIDSAPMKRRFNEGDTVEHTLILKWGEGTIAEVRPGVRPGEGGNEFRVTFPDAEFDPNVASAFPGRIPPKEGAWLKQEVLRLVKRAPVVLATISRDSDPDDGALKAGLWREGCHVLEREQSKLYNAHTGGRFSNLLSGWTVCPGNDSNNCLDRVDAEMCATHPNRGTVKVVVKLCPLGVLFNCNCPLVTGC
jgi:hypothetical protein